MRLIDADALIKAIVRKEPFSDCARVVIAECMEEVRHAPTIELRCEECEAFDKTRLLIPQPERKTGKWMPLQVSMAHPPYQCSCCFRNAPMVETGCLVNRHLEALLTDWCPWCGAKMEEGDDT